MEIKKMTMTHTLNRFINDTLGEQRTYTQVHHPRQQCHGEIERSGSG